MDDETREFIEDVRSQLFAEIITNRVRLDALDTGTNTQFGATNERLEELWTRFLESQTPPTPEPAPEPEPNPEPEAPVEEPEVTEPPEDVPPTEDTPPEDEPASNEETPI